MLVLTTARRRDTPEDSIFENLGKSRKAAETVVLLFYIIRQLVRYPEVAIT
jgi:hypothetical protein